MTRAVPPPFGESYWVEPASLLAGPHPGGSSVQETALRVSALLDTGIRCIVNLTLTQEERPEQRYEALFEARAATEALQVQTVRFALFDGSCPSPAAVAELLDIIDGCMNSGLPVYVHCMLGLGRTGVAVGCHQVRHGRCKPRAAVKHLTKLRRGTANHHLPSPLTEEQARRIRTWSRGQ